MVGVLGMGHLVLVVALVLDRQMKHRVFLTHTILDVLERIPHQKTGINLALNIYNLLFLYTISV
jgi:hypothetical protein